VPHSASSLFEKMGFVTGVLALLIEFVVSSIHLTDAIFGKPTVSKRTWPIFIVILDKQKAGLQ
jgi:hypothetical protein